MNTGKRTRPSPDGIGDFPVDAARWTRPSRVNTKEHQNGVKPGYNKAVQPRQRWDEKWRDLA